MFQKVDAYAGDPILSLMERFKEDPRSDKVNLSIGLYYNEDGIIPQLKAVAEAEARLNAAPHGASLYLPMEGLNTYRNAIAPLLFGADHAVLAQKRVATIQTLGGSGALKVGADFLKKYFPDLQSIFQGDLAALCTKADCGHASECYTLSVQQLEILEFLHCMSHSMTKIQKCTFSLFLWITFYYTRFDLTAAADHPCQGFGIQCTDFFMLSKHILIEISIADQAGL